LLLCAVLQALDNQGLVPAPNAPHVLPGPGLGLSRLGIGRAYLVSLLLCLHGGFSCSSNYGQSGRLCHLPSLGAGVPVHGIPGQVDVDRPTAMHLALELILS